jgi:hypothetical protein
VSAAGAPGDASSRNWRFALALTGRFVAFNPDAMNLVPGLSTTSSCATEDAASRRSRAALRLSRCFVKPS